MFCIKAAKKIIGLKINNSGINGLGTNTVFRQKNTLSDNNLPVKPMFHCAVDFQSKTAIYDNTGSYTFSNLFVEAKELSGKISRQLNGKIGERVMFLCPNDASYVITIWAIWMSGQIAVPLSHLHPENLLEYYVNDTNSTLLVTSPVFQEQMDKLSKKSRVKLYTLDEALLKSAKTKNIIDQGFLANILPLNFYQDHEAMILYTSGTTGPPKGVVLTHKNLSVQIKMLTEAWKWAEKDVILHTLPLHHVHGTVNALFCPLFIGASTVMLPKFNAKEVWMNLLNKNDCVKERVSVFMAVPTIYSKLIDEFDASLKTQKDNVRQHLTRNVRLMVSGSAPLPESLYDRWLQISGHRLLERYGMTETGMSLSNLYDSNRQPGYVGMPLPSVSVALADTENGDILIECSNSEGEISVVDHKKCHADITGELFVKGDSVFKEYYNKPSETAKEFTRDGWFKTGDISQYVRKLGRFKMLGRKSADIIKSGGYKISALNIETILLSHPGIKDCAVLGVKDEVYGERIAAVMVVDKSYEITLEILKRWSMDKMPKYWIPSILKVVDDIPKNAMGKVNKKELNKALFQ